MIIKVISGGQIGADQAGLAAAEFCNIPTGGMAPKGWMTKRGQMRATLEHYGLKESEYPNYPPRTTYNVKSSDGTLALARDFESPGEKLTYRLCRENKKPYLAMSVTYITTLRDEALLRAVEFIRDNKIRILNVAGNADESIYLPCYRFLLMLFQYERDMK